MLPQSNSNEQTLGNGYLCCLSWANRAQDLACLPKIWWMRTCHILEVHEEDSLGDMESLRIRIGAKEKDRVVFWMIVSAHTNGLIPLLLRQKSLYIVENFLLEVEVIPARSTILIKNHTRSLQVTLSWTSVPIIEKDRLNWSGFFWVSHLVPRTMVYGIYYLFSFDHQHQLEEGQRHSPILTSFLHLSVHTRFVHQLLEGRCVKACDITERLSLHEEVTYQKLREWWFHACLPGRYQVIPREF